MICAKKGERKEYMKTYDCNMCHGKGVRTRIELRSENTIVCLNPIILNEYLEKYPHMKIVKTYTVHCHFCDGTGKVDWITNVLDNPRIEDIKKRYFKYHVNLNLNSKHFPIMKDL
jgi:RecJ-like exonuclease